MSVIAWVMFIVGILIGVIGGFFIARQTMKNYLQKNPPINEDMLKQLSSGMGRNLSQKQLNQMMSQMKNSYGKNKK